MNRHEVVRFDPSSEVRLAVGKQHLGDILGAGPVDASRIFLTRRWPVLSPLEFVDKIPFLLFEVGARPPIYARRGLRDAVKGQM